MTIATEHAYVNPRASAAGATGIAFCVARLLPQYYDTPVTLTVNRTLTPLRALFTDLKGKNVADDHRTG